MPIILKNGIEIAMRTHHDRAVSVIKNVEGEHRKHCLCWYCGHFAPDSKDNNCPYANQLYGLCCAPGGPLVTPVYECEDFSLTIRERPAGALKEE